MNTQRSEKREMDADGTIKAHKNKEGCSKKEEKGREMKTEDE